MEQDHSSSTKHELNTDFSCLLIGNPKQLQNPNAEFEEVVEKRLSDHEGMRKWSSGPESAYYYGI